MSDEHLSFDSLIIKPKGIYVFISLEAETYMFAKFTKNSFCRFMLWFLKLKPI